MECPAQGLDSGFLDRPEQGRCLFQISVYQHQSMVKLLWMEYPGQGIFCVEFIGLCHINANIRLISRENSPDFSSTFAEGNSRAPVFSQQEMGSAKQVPDHLNC